MSAYPNKPTIIAAALYGISEQHKTETRKGIVTLPWSDLSNEQRKPFFDAAEFLLGQAFGVGVQSIDRAKLAANIEKQKLVDADANVAVAVFVSIASVLP
jgi:ABC-type transporter MlaC component